MSLVTLWLIWLAPGDRRRNIQLGGLLGPVILIPFFIAAFTATQYGGSLNDAGEENQFMGIDGNSLVFSVLFILQCMGLYATLEKINVS
jgi:hypothetical protein